MDIRVIVFIPLLQLGRNGFTDFQGTFHRAVRSEGTQDFRLCQRCCWLPRVLYQVSYQMEICRNLSPRQLPLDALSIVCYRSTEVSQSWWKISALLEFGCQLEPN